MANEEQRPAETHGRELVPTILLVALALGVVVVIALGVSYKLEWTTGLAWGFALYVSGALIGFLFGIPKVPDRNGQAAPKLADAAADGTEGESAPAVKRVDSETRRASGINSNLVEVSDWLTKIIVGVGLVELKNLPTYGLSLATFIADSLSPIPAQGGGAKVDVTAGLVSIGGAIALFFGVLGFITGYLLTRIFLAVIMNDADRSAEEASTWRLEGGGVVDTPTMLSSFKRSLDDLQAKVIGLLPQPKLADGAPPSPGEAMPAPAPAPAPAQTPAAPPGSPILGTDGQPVAPATPIASPTEDLPSGEPPAEPSVQPIENEVEKGEGGEAAPPAVTAPTLPPADFAPTLRMAIPPVLQPPPPSSPTLMAPGAAAPPPPVVPPSQPLTRKVLWVDNRPTKNALVTDRLRAAGVHVVSALNTTDALALVRQNDFDVVITDMHRKEQANDGVPSGLRLISALRGMSPVTASSRRPLIFVYCAKSSLVTYGRQAEAMGADFATSSEVDLLGMLKRLYPGFV